MRKRKRIYLWAAIIAGATMVILYIFAICYPLIFGTQLERKLAELRKAGDPICLADLAQKSIPPEQNGMTYIIRAQDDLNAIDTQLSNHVDDQGNYKPEDMKKIEDILNSYPNVYPLLEQAAACKEFDLNLDFSLPPSQMFNQLNISMFRQIAQYIDARIRVLVLNGDREEALRSAILLLQISRHLENSPFTLTYSLVNGLRTRALEGAAEILAAGSNNDGVREKLDLELSLNDSIDKLRTAMKTERALALDQYRFEIPHPWLLLQKDQGELSLLNAFNDYLNNSLHPYSDYVVMNKRIGSMRSCDIFAELTRPVLEAVLRGSYRVQALVRAVRIINALQEKAPPSGGKIPTMAELGLPEEAGIDPFNGKPLIIKKPPEGWLVYSVGENLIDDGGKVEDEETNSPPLDIGFGPKIPKPQSEDKEPAQE